MYTIFYSIMLFVFRKMGIAGWVIFCKKEPQYLRSIACINCVKVTKWGLTHEM